VPLGNLEGVTFTRDFEMDEAGSRSTATLSAGNLEGGLLYCGLRRMSKGRLSGTSLHRGSAGEPGSGLVYRGL